MNLAAWSNGVARIAMTREDVGDRQRSITLQRRTGMDGRRLVAPADGCYPCVGPA